LSLALLFSCQQKTDPNITINIIPYPEKTSVQSDIFELNANTAIVFDSEDIDLQRAARYIAGFLTPVLGTMELRSSKSAEKNATSLVLLTDPNLHKEAYVLSVQPSGIEITGGSAQGVFWGLQSLRQLMPEWVEKDTTVQSVSLQCVVISDAPRFAYRGMHLDVCRHFFGVEDVKRYIDLLVMHKFNTFHWHLTEDQGWRIEIKQYRELTRIGARRPETVIGRNSGEYDGIAHGGFYTQDEVKEIVKYAEDRFITVIPEIEMPGHSLAALASYPELGCTGGPYQVATTWGVFNDVYCAGNEKTFEFLEAVIDEVCELFPNSPYIHIGGDECPKGAWEKCPKCQARIKAESLADEHQLQSYFITRIEKYIHSKGKRIIGWDEILEGGLAPDATVMSWRGEEGGIAAAQMGHDVIMTPNPICYFDHYQSEDTDNEPLAIGGFTDCAEIYGWNPIPPSLNDKEAKFILGGQGNVWTEYITNMQHVEYMVLPRMAALSEVLWTGQKPGYEDFVKRLQQLFIRYDAAGYNYARHLKH